MSPLARPGGVGASAVKIAAALAGSPVKAGVGEGRAQVGGGALPQSIIASVTVDLVHPAFPPQELSARLRARPLPGR